MDFNARNRDDVIILKLGGRIIGSASGQLRQSINEQIANIEAPKILFDCEDISTMDSSGLGVLMATHASIARQGGRVGVIHVGTNIKNLIIRSRLITVFEHFDSEDEAVAALSGGSK
jgi:anti-anti-sigma factor